MTTRTEKIKRIELDRVIDSMAGKLTHVTVEMTPEHLGSFAKRVGEKWIYRDVELLRRAG